mgnify:CR=1 FL=1
MNTQVIDFLFQFSEWDDEIHLYSFRWYWNSQYVHSARHLPNPKEEENTFSWILVSWFIYWSFVQLNKSPLWSPKTTSSLKRLHAILYHPMNWSIEICWLVESRVIKCICKKVVFIAVLAFTCTMCNANGLCERDSIIIFEGHLWRSHDLNGKRFLLKEEGVGRLFLNL